jgi:hypothetical protein
MRVSGQPHSSAVLHPVGTALATRWIGVLSVPQTRSGRGGEEKESLHCPSWESNPSRPARIIVTLLTELPINCAIVSPDILVIVFQCLELGLWGICWFTRCKTTRVYPKVSGLSHNEINNNKDSLRSNTKGYGGKTHYTDSQNSDTAAPSGRELYNLQFSFQAASPETFGYIPVFLRLHFICAPMSARRTCLPFPFRFCRVLSYTPRRVCVLGSKDTRLDKFQDGDQSSVDCGCRQGRVMSFPFWGLLSLLGVQARPQ